MGIELELLFNIRPLWIRDDGLALIDELKSGFLGLMILSNQPSQDIGHEIDWRTMGGVLDLEDTLELIHDDQMWFGAVKQLRKFLPGAGEACKHAVLLDTPIVTDCQRCRIDGGNTTARSNQAVQTAC